MLGIGGGMVMSPLLLELGMMPEAVPATSSTTVVRLLAVAAARGASSVAQCVACCCAADHVDVGGGAVPRARLVVDRLRLVVRRRQPRRDAHRANARPVARQAVQAVRTLLCYCSLITVCMLCSASLIILAIALLIGVSTVLMVTTGSRSHAVVICDSFASVAFLVQACCRLRPTCRKAKAWASTIFVEACA